LNIYEKRFPFIGFDNTPALHRQTSGALVPAANALSSFIGNGLSISACATLFDEGCVIVFRVARKPRVWIIFVAIWQALADSRGFYNSLETHVNAITRRHRNLHRKFE